MPNYTLLEYIAKDPRVRDDKARIRSRRFAGAIRVEMSIPAPSSSLDAHMEIRTFARTVVLLGDYTEQGAFGIASTVRWTSRRVEVWEDGPRSVSTRLRLVFGRPVDLRALGC